MKNRLIAGLASSVLLIQLSCAMFAERGDYADYRLIRMEKDQKKQLIAMRRYTEKHPNGSFTEKVQAERQKAESQIFERGKNHREGLQFYLQAYPDGIYVKRAQSRLKAIHKVENRRQQDLSRAENHSAKRQVEMLDRRRSWASRFLKFWMEVLLSIPNWGSPIEEVAQAYPLFSAHFGGNPRPRCSRTECMKAYQVHFAIPIPGGTRIEKTIPIALRLHLDQGNLQRADLLLPNYGFSLWYELEHQSISIAEDAIDRQRSTAWALAKIRELLNQIDKKAKTGFLEKGTEPVSTDFFRPLDPKLLAAVVDPSADDPMVVTGLSQFSKGPTQVLKTDQQQETDQQQAPDMIISAADGQDLSLSYPDSKDSASESVPPVPDRPHPEPKDITESSTSWIFKVNSLRLTVIAASPSDPGFSYDGITIAIDRAE